MNTDKIREVCTEMMEQRGYTVTPHAEYLLARSDDDTIVAFTTPEKVTVPKIKEYASWMGDLGVSHAILIYIEITPPVKAVVKNPNVFNIELFNASQMMYNITKHRLVPLHTRLSKVDGEKILKTLKGEIPNILDTDPVSEFYNFKVDDIIRVERKGIDGMISPTYRIVVK
jgi:DNA-directed RNA polymerase I, II, and III subunit RPABC1